MSRAVVAAALLLTSATAFAADDDEAYPTPLTPPADPPPTPYYPAQVPYTPGGGAPGTYAPQAPAPQYVYAQAAEPQGPKDPWTAGLLSLGATVGPPLIASMVMSSRTENDREDVVSKVALTSVMIGPSVGHIYAGKFITPGVVVRTLGFAVAMSGAASDDWGEAIGRILIGSIGIVSGAIVDIALVGKSVREYNAEHVRVTPMVTPVVDPNGNRGVQVGINGAF